MDFGSAPAPLFRSESLRSKRTELLEELDSDNALSTGVFGGVVGVVSLPPHPVVRRKRTYQGASNQDQLSLEERLTKRARVVPGAKKRRLR